MKHGVYVITNSLVKICLVTWGISRFHPTGQTGNTSGRRWATAALEIPAEGECPEDVKSRHGESLYLEEKALS